MAEGEWQAEEVAARMLGQVLHTHAVRWQLSLRDLVHISNALLGDRCKQFCAAGAPPHAIMTQTCTWLKQQLRAAASSGLFPGLAWRQREDLSTLHEAEGLQAYEALRLLLNELGQEEQMDFVAGMRICLMLATSI